MLWDILKLILVVIVLVFAWLFLRSYTGDVGLFTILNNTQRLEVTDAELWHNISPLNGSVTIDSINGARNGEPSSEYLRFTASHSNTDAIDMTGWSVQSLVSDTRVYLPPATLMLKMQRGGNTTEHVHLAPGEYIILRTGRSPIAQYAQSFHTNKCIGYLNQFVEFTPKVKSSCIDPGSILPATVENVRTYGAQCIEFLNNAQKCTTYSTAMPSYLLPACRDLVARKLNYHTCLSDSFEREGHHIFNNGGWYLYLDHEAELWRNNYEALRLLDADGKVVDVLRY